MEDWTFNWKLILWILGCEYSTFSIEFSIDFSIEFWDGAWRLEASECGGWKAIECGGWKAIECGGWKATECGDCGC